MASSRPSPTKTSSNPKTTDRHSKEPPFNRPQAARAHRDDTPEGKAQRARVPKTHPTRSPSMARKDKSRQQQKENPQEQTKP